MKANGRRFKPDRREYFCTQHIVYLYNLLLQDVVKPLSLDDSERSDGFTEEKFISGWQIPHDIVTRYYPVQGHQVTNIVGCKGKRTSYSSCGMYMYHCGKSDANLPGPLDHFKKEHSCVQLL